MLTLAGICVLTLFALLFLLGMEIGKKWTTPEVEATIATRAHAVPTPTPTSGPEALVDSANKLTNNNAK